MRSSAWERTGCERREDNLWDIEKNHNTLKRGTWTNQKQWPGTKQPREWQYVAFQTKWVKSDA